MAAAKKRFIATVVVEADAGSKISSRTVRSGLSFDAPEGSTAKLKSVKPLEKPAKGNAAKAKKAAKTPAKAAEKPAKRSPAKGKTAKKKA